MGFTSEYEREARERFGIASRHMSRWSLPESEVVRAVQIIVPEGDLMPFEDTDIGQMRWLTPAGKGCATVVSVFIAEPPDRFNWVGPETGGDMIGIMRCPTRFTWAVSSTQVLDPATQAMIEDGRRQAMAMAAAHHVAAPQDSQSVRLAVWGSSATPADLFFVDLGYRVAEPSPAAETPP